MRVPNSKMPSDTARKTATVGPRPNLVNSIRRGVLDRVVSDAGSHLVEIGVGMLVLSVAVIGLIGSMAAGMTLVGHSRQRSAAVAVAQEQLERVRSLPYDRIALNAAPTQNADPEHPDGNVIDNLSYRVAAATIEPLVVDPTKGALAHVDEGRTVGKTALSIYQYVTWVDDVTIAGAQNYKRVTVVAAPKSPLRAGTTKNIVQSTFVSEGTVTLPESTPPQAASGSPSTVPSSTPPPPCAGDTVAPSGSLEITSGTGAEQLYTNSTSIQVRLDETDACPNVVAELSNDGVTFMEVATHVDSQPVTVAWTIPAGDGGKTIYARFRDSSGNVSSTLTGQILLDQTSPTVSGSLRVASCSLNGSDRVVALTWDASMDGNLLGYRLFKSVESGRFIDVATAVTTSASDTERKSHGSVRYVVRAYDKVGNESADSNTLSFSRNSC